MFHRDRLVEVYADRAGQGWFGSGYLLADRLVLTARHVVGAGERVVQVRRYDPAGASEWVPACRVVPSAQADVAVVELAGSTGLAQDWGPPPLGRIEGSVPVACQAVGFPQAQQLGRRRDVDQVLGQLAPLTGGKAGRLSLHVLGSSLLARPDGASLWAGMSGAAVFAGPFLIGVVVIDPINFGSSRLEAVPIIVLAERPLVELAEGHGVAVVARPVQAAFSYDLGGGVQLRLGPPYRQLPPGVELADRPSLALQPRYGLVPFLPRRQIEGEQTDLVEQLVRWCTTSQPFGLRLVTGPGGAGKTRLAAELCTRLLAYGWDAGLVEPPTAGPVTPLAPERPTLLVVDDADSATERIIQLAGQLLYRQSAPPVRILLLARSRGSWWDTLRARQPELDAVTAGPLRLDPDTAPLTSQERNQHHQQALAAFAAVLHTTAPPGSLPDLAGTAFGSPLVLHMIALLAVLGESPPGVDCTNQAPPLEVILDAVLRRETLHWATAFDPLGLSDQLRKDVIMVASLAGAADSSQLKRLLTALDDLHDASQERLGAVADAVHELYPGQPYLAPLEPDLLTERLVAIRRADVRLLLRVLEQAPSPAQVARLLTVLTRAATNPLFSTRSPVHQALSGLLHARLPALIDLAEQQVRDIHGWEPAVSTMAAALAAALAAAPVPDAAAEAVDKLPKRNVVFLDLAAVISTQAVEQLRRRVCQNPELLPDLAGALTTLANRLAEVGRRAEALAPAQQAVEHYRQLAAANPTTYRPDLAGALTTLAALLAEQGQQDEGLEPAEQAVAYYRQLASALPTVFLHNFVSSLDTLADVLTGLGRHQEAATIRAEAKAVTSPAPQ